MSDRFDDLIRDMTRELVPVRPSRAIHGLAIIGAIWLLCVVGFLLWNNLRSDFIALRPHDMVLLIFLMNAVLCAVAIWHAVRMATPRVGQESSGWRWAVLIAVTVPIGGAFSYLAAPAHSHVSTTSGVQCLTEALLIGLGVAVALIMWLRRGAPTSPNRAALLVGLASGSAGAAAVTLHCAENILSHIGLWHSLAAVVYMAASVIIVPRLIRW